MRIEMAVDDRSRALKVRERGRERVVATKDPENNLLPQNKKANQEFFLSFLLGCIHSLLKRFMWGAR